VTIRERLSLASGTVNYRILRLLHDSPRHAQQLADHVDRDARNVRVHLKTLRDENFLSYVKVGRRHYYHVKTPFETTSHQWILGLVTMDDPYSSSETPPIERPDPDPRIVDVQREYWSTLIEGMYSIMVHQGSLSEQERVRERLDEIDARLDRLKSLS
jgi:DNA-binding transcriptional ArsR family regulator